MQHARGLLAGGAVSGGGGGGGGGCSSVATATLNAAAAAASAACAAAFGASLGDMVSAHAPLAAWLHEHRLRSISGVVSGGGSGGSTTTAPQKDGERPGSAPRSTPRSTPRLAHSLRARRPWMPRSSSGGLGGSGGAKLPTLSGVKWPLRVRLSWQFGRISQSGTIVARATTSPHAAHTHRP